ncbi:MAG: peptidase S1, partial [Planctomycetota bacterium]|nr:peptidase S1 [Planctomycetota bacterium]
MRGVLTVRRTVTSLAVVLVAALALTTNADVITLKSGQKIEAPVLKETDNALFLDVGVDVLRVPLEKIASRAKNAAAAATR